MKFFVIIFLFLCNIQCNYSYGKTESQIKEEIQKKRQKVIQKTQLYLKELQEMRQNLSENDTNEGILKNKLVQSHFKKHENKRKIKIEEIDEKTKKIQKILDLNQDDQMSDATLIKILDQMTNSAQQQLDSNGSVLKSQTVLLKDYQDVNSYMFENYKQEFEKMTGEANGIFQQVRQNQKIELFAFTRDDLEFLTDHSEGLEDSLKDYYIDILDQGVKKNSLVSNPIYYVSFMILSLLF